MSRFQTMRLRRPGTLAALGLILLAGPALANENDILQRATDKVIEQIAADLDKASLEGVVNVAVVTVRGDEDGYVTAALEAAVTRSPFKLYVRDTRLDLLAGEIEFGDRKGDIMKPETVQRFGELEGVDAIIYGDIWDHTTNLWGTRGHVKAIVNMGVVETGENIWTSGMQDAEALIHWSDAVARFWQFPMLVLALFFLLMILLIFLAKLRRAFRPAGTANRS